MLWPQGRGTGGPAVPILTFDGDTAIDCNQAHGHPDRLENIMFQLLKTFLIRQLVHLFATFFLVPSCLLCQQRSDSLASNVNQEVQARDA